MAKRCAITFVAVGDVERVKPRKGKVGTYVWKTGYSENGNTAPWVTRKEAQASAKSRGCRAVFVPK